jgi:hypothetical protein
VIGRLGDSDNRTISKSLNHPIPSIARSPNDLVPAKLACSFNITARKQVAMTIPTASDWKLG